MKRHWILFWFVALALLLLFHKYFLPGPLVWGDAPYFYSKGLTELLRLPSAWTHGGNNLGGINLFLWISPLMVLYGVLGGILHFNNDLILRLLFYLPSLAIGVPGIYFLTKYLKRSRMVSLFAILLYFVNTYYLLLVDGGQVGVVLAYGIFPLAILLFLRFVDKTNIKNFWIALLCGFVLTTVDFRVAAIAILTTILLGINQWRKLWVLAYLSLCLLGLSMYWIIPALKLTSGSLDTSVTGLQTTSILNTLLLSAPNWPANQFGQTVAPYFYFIFISILIFIPLFVSKERKIFWFTFIFLFFAFLAKGNSYPLGVFYGFLMNNKIGSVFRDSTKFFIPLVLIGGILVGESVELIQRKIKLPIVALVSIYLIFVVWQAIFGNMTGVLGKNPNLKDYQIISAEISKQNGFMRSLWFTERSSFAYNTETKQVVDARSLADFRPFASMNGGTGDRFNFINNNQYLDFFNLLGIKYLVLNGNPRVSTLSKSDLEDWERLNNLLSHDIRLTSLNLGTNFPVYEIGQTHPNEFFVNKAFVVVGPDDVYAKLAKLNGRFSVGNQGFLFSDDGKFDLNALAGFDPNTVDFIFNGENANDLKMNLLQKYFVAPKENISSQWAVRSPADYLLWKYELLENGINSHDFDYGLGIAFSTRYGEEIKYNLNVSESGKYYLVVRSMKGMSSGDLDLKFNDNEEMVKRHKPGDFEWFFGQPIDLAAGNHQLIIKNTGGLQAINAVGLIPIRDMDEATQITKTYMDKFKSFDINSKGDQVKISQLVDSNKWVTAGEGQGRSGWLIFTDSYNPLWQISRVDGNLQSSAFPMYSMVNGFYLDGKHDDGRLEFKGEESLRWGIYFSIISALLIVIVTLWKKRE